MELRPSYRHDPGQQEALAERGYQGGGERGHLMTGNPQLSVQGTPQYMELRPSYRHGQGQQKALAEREYEGGGVQPNQSNPGELNQILNRHALSHALLDKEYDNVVADNKRVIRESSLKVLSCDEWSDVAL